MLGVGGAFGGSVGESGTERCGVQDVVLAGLTGVCSAGGGHF